MDDIDPGWAVQWAHGDEYILGKADELGGLIQEVLMSLENQAIALRDVFREERQRIQKEEWGRSKREGRKSKDGYAPINLFVRPRKGSLEIFWQEVHVVRGTNQRRYIYIPKGRDGNYSERSLRPRAKPYELELVLSTERRAAQLRHWWRVWGGMRDAIRATRKGVTAGLDEEKLHLENGDVKPNLVPSVEI